jgi:hypothetical protein
MSEYTDKSKENQSTATNDRIAQQRKIGQTLPSADNRPEAIAQRKMEEAGNNSPRVQQLKGYQDMADNYVLGIAQRKENKTGLPDNLKKGTEDMSGLSMDDVKVHYNSSMPAQLQAHAYAQGTDIHIAPGQEKHLPHEAWHVVQQKQGRVKPTVQLKGKVNINDDTGLEKEADLMGAQAMLQQQTIPKTTQLRSGLVAAGNTLQRAIDVNATSFSELVAEQIEYQHPDYLDGKKGYTTVGFEHEFAQMDTDTLKGVSHLTLSKSDKKMPLTGLPFILETDADNALELVSPPFVVKTISPAHPIPDPGEIKKIDDIIKARLSAMVSPLPKMSELVTDFETDPALKFLLPKVKVEAANLSPNTVKDYHAGNADVTAGDIQKIVVKPSKKGGTQVNISSQINFATNAQTYDKMKSLSGPADSNYKTIFKDLQTKITEGIMASTGRLRIVPTPNLLIFFRQMARTLSDGLAAPSMAAVREKQEAAFRVQKSHARGVAKKSMETESFSFDASASSHVKDVDGVWLKDTIWNFGLGLLNAAEWGQVHQITTDAAFTTGVEALKISSGSFSDKLKDRYLENFATAIAAMRTSIALIAAKSASYSRLSDETRKEIYTGPADKVGFMEHKGRWLGARQDTLITGARKVQIPGIEQRVHVVETRADGIKTLELLKIDHEIRTTKKVDLVIAKELHHISTDLIHADRAKYESWLEHLNSLLTEDEVKLKEDQEIMDEIYAELAKMVAARRVQIAAER